ncbi:MAG: hypothetical protein ABI685_08545 [Ferruginibacter sp.]
MKMSIMFLFFLISCVNNKAKDTIPKAKNQVLDFGKFTIETPNSWKKIEEVSFDSYGGAIAIDSTDTIGFGLGQNSSFINETDIELMNYIKSKHNILTDTIDGYVAKILIPKEPGNSMIGVFIDSLWTHGQENDQFNMNGSHLKPVNEQLFIQAIKTIKFHKNK